MILDKMLMTRFFQLLKTKEKYKTMMIVLFLGDLEIWKNNRQRQSL